MVKMVARGFTAAADAYLTPHIMRRVLNLSSFKLWTIICACALTKLASVPTTVETFALCVCVCVSHFMMHAYFSIHLTDAVTVIPKFKILV